MTTGKESALILGCMNLGGPWQNGSVEPGRIRNTLSCVQTALEENIRSFDHADIYGRGTSETAFGHVWSELGIRREDVFVQSKCGIRFAGDTGPNAPHRFDFSYEHITASAKKSLERLQTDYLDVFLLHRPDVLAEPEEIARAFTDLSAQRLVRTFGVSNFNASQISLLQSALSHPIVANQVEFNLMHADLIDESVTFDNRHQRQSYRGDGTFEYCREKMVTLQAYSPLAKGRLTPPPHDADDATRHAASAVMSIAGSKGVSPEAILLAWILRIPGGIRPVIGTTRPERIRDLAKAVSVNLSREEWYTLFRAGRGRDLP